MLPRRDEVRAVLKLLASHPVVGIVGPRQVGKTTLARLGAGGSSLAGRIAYHELGG